MPFSRLVMKLVTAIPGGTYRKRGEGATEPPTKQRKGMRPMGEAVTSLFLWNN